VPLAGVELLSGDAEEHVVETRLLDEQAGRLQAGGVERADQRGTLSAARGK
jgi:hypothetical protein